MNLSIILNNNKIQLLAFCSSIFIHGIILASSKFNYNQAIVYKQAFQVSLVAKSSLNNAKNNDLNQSFVNSKNLNSNQNYSSKKIAIGKVSDSSEILNSLDSEVVYDAKQLNNQPPSYPDLARERGIEGEVVLKAKIDQYGNAISLELIKSSGSQMLDQSAIKTVSNWHFIPAKINNKNVVASVIIPIVFKII